MCLVNNVMLGIGITVVFRIAKFQKQDGGDCCRRAHVTENVGKMFLTELRIY